MKVSLLLLLVTATFATARAQLDPKSLNVSSSVVAFGRSIAQSSYVFTGVVTQVRASQTRAVRPSDKSIVVTVRPLRDTVLLSPGGMRPLTGTSLTIVVPSAGDFVVGQQSLFFAYGVAIDNGIALREVAHMPTDTTDRATMTRRFAAANEWLKDVAVGAMANSATAVFVGRIERVTRVTGSDLIVARPSRARPQVWQQASIRVSRFFKRTTGPVVSSAQNVVTVLIGAEGDGAVNVPEIATGRTYLFGVRRLGARYVPVDLGIRTQSDTVRLLRVMR